MNLLGFQISRTKQVPATTSSLPSWTGGNWYGSWWWPTIREPFTGAWQRNMELRPESVLSHPAVYACVTLISSDIAKLPLLLVRQDSAGIWTETTNPAFSPVLRSPNQYQNRIQFIQQWLVSKLVTGNTYVLKGRDDRNVVRRLYVLDPQRTKTLVSPDGDVYYQLSKDNLSGIDETSVSVPSSEIIHDRMTPLYHPLCGISPLIACGLAATQGINIANNSVNFFANGARPSGVLSAPGLINDDTAKRLKQHWEDNYSGNNIGKVAVLGDGLKYEPMSQNAVDSQLSEQLGWSDRSVATAFRVPPYMIGIGPMPSYNNVEALNQQYYTQCLQSLIEDIELSLDIGLGMAGDDIATQEFGTEFDIDNLLRMDTATQIRTYAEGIRGGLMQPNEGRRKLGLPATEGGDAAYLQQQNYSLAALAKRDSQEDPFSTGSGKGGGNGGGDASASDAGSNNDNQPAADAGDKTIDPDTTAAIAAWELRAQLDRLAA